MKSERQYKSSESIWISKIPEDWKIEKLKQYFSLQKGLAITKQDLQPQGIPVINYGQIHSKQNTALGNNGKLYRFVDGKFAKESSLLSHGDFVFADTSEDRKGCGNCAYIDTSDEQYAGYHTLILKNKNLLIDSKYLAYQFLSEPWRFQIRSRVEGVKLYTISKILLGQCQILVPPQREQEQIVKYLDWKTSEINRLINGYQKQIRLLDEYTLALIDSCVTNGIRNSQKKRVQSNWVSEIPCNWSFDKVKQHFEIRKRIAGKEGYDVISITQQGLKVKNISSNEGQMALDYSKYQFVYPDEFAMNHMDLLTGYIGLSEVFGVTSPDYRVFAALCPDKLNLKYFLYVFQLGYKRKIFYGLGRGAANKGRWRLPAQNFLNYEIPIPPKGEQDEIVEFLDKKLTLTAQAKTSFEKRVNLLKEYKTALISNVVTGQVDVRDVEIPEFETVELTDTDSDVEAEVEG